MRRFRRRFDKLKESVWPPAVLFENSLPVLARYSTRLFVAAVWCGVLWAFLGTDALPRQYIEEERRDVTDTPCFLFKPAEVFADVLVQGSDVDFGESSQTIVTVLHENGSLEYKVVTVQLDTRCQNLLEVQTVGISESDLNMTTANLSNGSLNIVVSSNSTRKIDLSETTTEDEDDLTLLYIPDGHFFALGLLLVFSLVCGFLAKLVFLPPLFGMIVSGIILTNAPHVDFAHDISSTWSSTIRNTALTIVLIRGGLALNPQQLKRLKRAVLLLAVLPCILEGTLDGVVAILYLEMPWHWGFLLGFVLAAISPTIVVPIMLSLQEEGYGIDKGIPTLILAAASLDVVICISFFGVFLGLTFSDGQLVLDILRGPIQIISALLYGIVFGLLLWVFPTKHFKQGSLVRNRVFLLLGLGLFGLFGSRRAMLGGSSLAGGGALAVLGVAFIAGQGWPKSEKAQVSRVLLIVWQLVQPLLFALIGAEVDFDFITPSLVGMGIVVIITGLTVRLIVSFQTVWGNGFNIKEKMFVSIAWLPKATVQAAIASIALDTAIEMNSGEEDEMLGKQVLTVAVLAILLTAPLGAVAITRLGPVLLHKSSDGEEQEAGDQEQGGHEGLAKSDANSVCDSQSIPATEILELETTPPTHHRLGNNTTMHFKEETV